MRPLLIDNYDSFTYILAHYLETASNSKAWVKKNDEITLAEIRAYKPSHIIISPGPGTVTNPGDFGINQTILAELSHELPILGVCLGHQGIIHHFGGKIEHAPEVRHGKTSTIKITDPQNLKSPSIFQNLPQQIEVMRYHSLIGTRIPDSLAITAKTTDNLCMAIQHKELPIYGIQFHPESFGTEHGLTMINNFLAV